MFHNFKLCCLTIGLILGLVADVGAQRNDYRAKLLTESASELSGQAPAPQSADTLWYRKPAPAGTRLFRLATVAWVAWFTEESTASGFS